MTTNNPAQGNVLFEVAGCVRPGGNLCSRLGLRACQKNKGHPFRVAFFVFWSGGVDQSLAHSGIPTPGGVRGRAM